MSQSRGAIALVLAFLVAGCTSSKQSNTSRTAREQLLVSNAVDQALAKIDFAAFSGAKVFVEEKYLDCIDKGYLVGSTRHRLMMEGGRIVSKAEEADVILELRSGGLGTDISDSFLGSPEIVLPGMVTLPEVRLVNRTRQSAVAKIGLVAYDAKTQEVLGVGGVSASLADDNNWFVLGVGPYQSGTVKKEIEHSVPLRPNQAYHQIPVTVAFQEPARKGGEAEPGKLRLAGEKQEPTTE